MFITDIFNRKCFYENNWHPQVNYSHIFIFRILWEISVGDDQMYLYRLYDKRKKMIYIGITSNDIILRLRTHFSGYNKYKYKDLWKSKIRYFDYAKTANLPELEIYEIYYINKYRPQFNRDSKYKVIMSERLKQLPELCFSGIKEVKEIGIDVNYYKNKFQERRAFLDKEKENSKRREKNILEGVDEDFPEPIDKLISIIKKENKINKFRDILIVKFIVCFGLKINELINLNLKNIDLTTKKIKLGNKNYRMTEELVIDYNNYLKERNAIDKILQLDLFSSFEEAKGPLFVSRCKERLSTRMIQQLLDDYSKKIGIKLTPEDLRAMFIKKMMEKSNDLQMLMNATGLSENRIKNIYFRRITG